MKGKQTKTTPMLIIAGFSKNGACPGKFKMVEIKTVTEPNIWTDNYQVRSYEVDAADTLSLPTILNMMQDSAGRHAKNLGVAIHDLLPQNFTWVLSRFMMHLDDPPGFDAEITVTTWPSGIQKAFALRDFEMAETGGRIFAKAVSAWLIIETGTKKLMRMKQFIDQINPYDERRAFVHDLNKLPPLEQVHDEMEFDVRYKDLDFNQHVNNVRFVEWIFDSLPFEILEQGNLKQLEINYLSEAFANDKITVRNFQTEGQGKVFFHSLINADSGKEIARARTVWAKFD